MAAFLNPDQPLATCVAQGCEGCAVSKDLHCHFQASDLIHFLLTVAPSFLLGGAGVYLLGGWWLVPWLVIALGFFSLVEIRVMCSHCPHYAEPGNSLKCWANYGSPKLWAYRPGPMSTVEKVVFLGGFALVWGYPLAALLVGRQWLLLIAYILSTAAFFATLKKFLCSQCMNFACPLNSVDESVRRKFFERNPRIAKAWGVEQPAGASNER